MNPSQLLSPPPPPFPSLRMQRVLCFGDSLTDGYYDGGTKFHPYASKLQQLLQVPVDHVGLSGWTTGEMVRAIEEDQCVDCNGKVWPGLRKQLKVCTYSHCIIMAGTNDVCDTPSLMTIANLRCLKQVVLQYVPFCATMTVPEMRDEQRDARLKKRREEINATLLDEPPCLDIAAHLPMASADACTLELLWQSDGLHLNPAGCVRRLPLCVFVKIWPGTTASVNSLPRFSGNQREFTVCDTTSVNWRRLRPPLVMALPKIVS